MIKIQYPYVNQNGEEDFNMIKTYSDNDSKMLLQVETNSIYKDAVDKYPCKYTYVEIDKPIVEEITE